MSEQETKPPRDKILLVFLCSDQREKKQKPNFQYIRVTPEQFAAGELPEPLNLASFDPKGMKSGIPGNVYEVECINGGDTIYPGTMTYKGKWPHEGHRLKWEIQERAFQTQRAAEALEKKANTERLFEETLDPLRTHYQRLPHFQRQAFLAAVMYYLDK